MDILIKNAYVISLDSSNTVLKNGAVYIQDDKIKQVGISAILEKEFSTSEVILDAKGRVVMPGMICAHMHYYSAFAVGMPLPPFPKGFLEVLQNLWWKLDKALTKEDVYLSALVGNIQAVRSGTTTVIDHHASPSYVTGSLDEIERAARELGVRSSLCYEVTDRNGFGGAVEGLKENERFIKKCQKERNDLISGLIGLHASFTLSNESMAQAEKLVKQLDTGVHIHVAEGKADMEHAKSKFDSTVVQRLQNFNLLNPKSILAHCIHLEDIDFPILQESRPNIVHQPRSNMNNAVGTLDIWNLQKYKLPFGLGTDGMSADMKVELLVAPLIQKITQNDNTIGTVELYNSLFNQNRKIIDKTMEVKTGSLQPEYKADVIISHYHPRTYLSSENVVGHMMFGVINEPVSTTIIDGNVRMNEGVIQGINEREIGEKCQEIAPEVWKRIKH